jgi:hypothetical protein
MDVRMRHDTIILETSSIEQALDKVLDVILVDFFHALPNLHFLTQSGCTRLHARDRSRWYFHNASGGRRESAGGEKGSADRSKSIRRRDARR